MEQSYFRFNGEFFKQTFGTSMGNALSPLLANVFLADFETKLSKLKTFPRVWLRYVDDVFAIVRSDLVDKTLTILNRRHPSIKFTHEREEGGKIAFLDVEVSRMGDELSFDVYRKPTSTRRIIPSDSHHCIQHKTAALNSLIHRMYSLPLSLENRRKELQKIEALAAVNGYPKHIVDKVNEKHAKKHELSLITTLTPSTTATEARRVSFTFYPKVTNQLQRIFRKYDLSLVYSNKNKLKSLLGTTKDKSSTLQKSGIYEIECQGCNSVYVGQTRRSIHTRLKEHRSHIRLNQPEHSSVASHVLDHMNERGSQHTVTEDSVRLLKEVNHSNRLDVHESIYIYEYKKRSDITLLNRVDGRVNSILFELL
jgi:hypothetical protein